MIREMSVAGTFYPARAVELERYFEHFNSVYSEEHKQITQQSRAIIVPHAGYIYSGYTANIAYRVLQNANIKNIVVIGPSHRVAFDGISLCSAQTYVTPFGDIQSASELAKDLHDNFNLTSILNPHAEHSTEVQFPFIKHYLDGVNILELVYGRATPELLSQIINFLLSKEDCAVVISTDLSHFYTLDEAEQLDNICLSAIENLDTKLLHNGCEACGMIGVEAMLLSASKHHLKANLLDYRTSADASDDTNRVVGYVSAYFS